LIAIIVAVVVAVILGSIKDPHNQIIRILFILVRKPSRTVTDSYPGSIFVEAFFDSVLLSTSSTLAKNYQTEFCSLVSS
jgi:hypothetical protein